MSLKLHFAPNSRASRISWLLEELELPYELNLLQFHPKDLKSEEHRARHPLGRIPVLEDGAISIYESGAIVEYIFARHKDGGLKPSVDSPNFPYYLQWFHYSAFLPAICSIFNTQFSNVVLVGNLQLPFRGFVLTVFQVVYVVGFTRSNIA